MKNLTFICIAASLLFSGCCSSTVIPQMGDIYTVTSIATTAYKSENAAICKAKNVCEQQQSLKVDILDQETVYQGVDQSQQTLVKLANKIFGDSKCSSDVTPADHDYKTTVIFKCD